MNIDKYPSDNWMFVGWKKIAGHNPFQVWKKQNNPQWLILGTGRKDIVYTDPMDSKNDAPAARANRS